MRALTPHSFSLDARALRDRIGHLIEAKSPALSRAFFSAASSLATPFTAGMGIAIIRLDDHGCSAILPDWWRNRDDDGLIHASALHALALLTARTYWSRHVDGAAMELRLVAADMRLQAEPRGALRAEFALAESDRERALFSARSEGRAKISCSARVYLSAGALAAEIETEWEITARPLLAGRAGAT